MNCLCAHLTDINSQEVENNDHKQPYGKRSYHSTDNFDSGEPLGVAQSHCLESRPYAVTEMEPECTQPNDVEQAINDTAPAVGEQRAVYESG